MILFIVPSVNDNYWLMYIVQNPKPGAAAQQSSWYLVAAGRAAAATAADPGARGRAEAGSRPTVRAERPDRSVRASRLRR